MPGKKIQKKIVSISLFIETGYLSKDPQIYLVNINKMRSEKCRK